MVPSRRESTVDAPHWLPRLRAQAQQRLRAHLAFVRHVGPCEAVPDTLFDSLEDWATDQGLVGPRIWMGIGHETEYDPPGAPAIWAVFR